VTAPPGATAMFEAAQLLDAKVTVPGGDTLAVTVSSKVLAAAG
jgi:hypothetical protein